MNTHRIKALPEYWDVIKAGRKSFEIRWDDRAYMEGDKLEIIRYDPDAALRGGNPYGEIIEARVGYIFRPGEDKRYGLEKGYVVMSIEPVRPPNLTPAQIERLAILLEEAAEVIQATGKTLRHGFDSYNPDRPSLGSNADQLANEIGHFEAAVFSLADAHDISITGVVTSRCEREARPSQYTHHQPKRE